MSFIQSSDTNDLNTLPVAEAAVRKEIRRTRRAIEKARVKLIDILEKLEKTEQSLKLIDQTLENQSASMRTSAITLASKDPNTVTKDDLVLGVYKIMQAHDTMEQMKALKEDVTRLTQLKEKWTGIKATKTEKLDQLILFNNQITNMLELCSQAAVI